MKTAAEWLERLKYEGQSQVCSLEPKHCREMLGALLAYVEKMESTALECHQSCWAGKDPADVVHMSPEERKRYLDALERQVGEAIHRMWDDAWTKGNIP